MNALAKAPPPPKPELSLEGMLTSLAQYGQPRVWMDKDGWSASIEMNVNVPGGKFSVRSYGEGQPMGFPTPSAAVRVVTERVEAALANMRRTP